MADKTVLHDLNSGMVLDREVFVALPPGDMSQVISSIRAAGAKPLTVVSSAEQFFTATNLVALIGTKDKRYLLVNEALGGFFTENQIEALGDWNPGAIQYLGDAAQAIKPAAVGDDLVVNLGGGGQQLGNYVFAKVPEGWSVGGFISLGPTKIKRKVKNSDGDGTLFFMSPGEFEKLWLFASKAWAGVHNAPVMAYFQTGIGQRKASLQDDRVSLGGNYIRRYEIEQIAKYRNWAMPAQVA